MLSEATQVLAATFEANDIRQHLEHAVVQLEYYEVYRCSTEQGDGARRV